MKNMTERIMFKVFSLSSEFSKANLKVGIDLAFKEPSKGTRAIAAIKSTYQSKRYTENYNVDNIFLFPNWYLILECKSVGDLKSKDSITIYPHQIYLLEGFIRDMYELMKSKPDLFFSDGSMLYINSKYDGGNFKADFGNNFSAEYISSELSVYYSETNQTSMGEPSFLIVLNGDYKTSFHMRMQELAGILYLLERTDFCTLATSLYGALGVPEGIPFPQTLSPSYKLFTLEETRDDIKKDTKFKGEASNIVKQLTGGYSKQEDTQAKTESGRMWSTINNM